MNIFLDLDGTLVDSRTRLYNLFCHLVPNSDFSFDAYWKLKRNGIGHFEILSSFFEYNEQDLQSFQNDWMREIEEKAWLQFDKPFSGISEKLIELKKQHHLYIVTARQYAEKVWDQVHLFGWEHMFTKILVTEQKVTKHELIQNNATFNSSDVIVGDTGNDVLTGKQLNIKTVAVTSGFLNRTKLESYHPDTIIDSVLNLSLS